MKKEQKGFSSFEAAFIDYKKQFDSIVSKEKTTKFKTKIKNNDRFWDLFLLFLAVIYISIKIGLLRHYGLNGNTVLELISGLLWVSVIGFIHITTKGLWKQMFELIEENFQLTVDNMTYKGFIEFIDDMKKRGEKK